MRNETERLRSVLPSDIACHRHGCRKLFISCQECLAPRPLRFLRRKRASQVGRPTCATRGIIKAIISDFRCIDCRLWTTLML